ncbi:Poly [ADP-ribose] polymerase 14, partial [Lamprotornis superbus]
MTNKETPVCTQQKTESCEKLEAEKATSKNSAVVVTTAFGEKIEDEILEMYFENKRKSGGGPIEAYVKKDEQVIITFQDEQVVLENVKEAIKDCMLIMLVENVGGLSEDDGDFSVEMIPELSAAVVTFTGNTDAEEFAKKLNQNPRARKQNITARCLEQTKSIRAENIPPNTPSHYITVYFENEKYGGAQTVDVQLLPDEDAAIITFGDQKDVTNILAKKHSLNKTPIFVYPYYTSLETALYGKEGPQIKKPDPITLPLDPYIWSYLQGDSSLIEAIDHEMAECNCVPAWPDPLCADPKVTLHPSAIFSERKRSVSRLAKTWKEKVSTAFSHSISKYEAIQCQVSTEVWEAIRSSFPHDEVLMIPHISKDLHVLVGEKNVVKKVEHELKLLIQKATREIEREKQRTELNVKTVKPGEYGILQITGLEEKFRTEFPDLQITYDYLQKCINLSGVPEEVYKVKGEILDHVHKMAKKTINIHPYIFQFLEHIDNETLSQSLFVSKQISAFYELGAGEIILRGSDPENLLKAEEEIKKELDHKSITLDDESVLQKEEWQMLAKENCSNGAVAVIQAETQIMIAGLSEAVAKAFKELSSFIDENTQVRRVIEGKPMALIKFFEKEKVDVWAPLQEKGVKVDFVTQKICEVISLSGPKTKVLEGVSLVEKILSGLHFKRVVIDLPGAKAYIKEQAHFLDPHIKQVFKCLILLEEQPEKQLEKQKVHSNRGKLCMQVTMGETVIALYEADLCTHPVDVVVNASNEDLRHIGGLADALSRAAGPALQQDGGIFGFPLEVCTYSIVSSIKETLEESKGNSSLKEVHLVGFSRDNIQAFRKAFREVFPDSLPSYRSPHHVSTAPQPKQRKTKHVKNFPVITTQEGLNIMLQIGSIEDATTSIVVISVGKDLQLDRGPLGKALLSKAGPMLQTGLSKEGGGRAEEGSVLKTKGYNLACSVVLHAVVPAWSQKNTPSKVLGDIITKCLEIAEELSLKSITFPAIGTGNLEFPRSVVAKLLFDKVFEFSSKNRINSLEEVHFLLHTKDTANIQEFSDELENRSVAVKGQKPPPNDTSQSLVFSAISSTSAHNVLEVTIGSLVFRVAEGDITKEEGDAIVNITNIAFNLKTAQQTGNKYIITQAGNLPCKNIIHFVYQDDIRSLVSQVLQECELRQYASVAFPAIGTALWSSEKHSPKEKTKNVLEKKIDLAVVQICGEDKKEVEEAEKWLRNAISKEQSQTEIVDEYISHFGEEEREELDDLEKKFRIFLDLKSTSIEISGITKDVCLASLAVHKMILRVKTAKETEAKVLQNSIEWKYFEKDSYVPFNSLTNMDLENAYKGEQKTIEVTIGERIYTVDMDRKTAVDAQGGQIPIIRIDKSEDQKSIVLPPTWDPMENERVKIVELKPDSREYKDVQEWFLQTCQSFKIEKIERVQNQYLWKNYQIKKCEMDIKNGVRNNERLLFHGTSEESLPLINNHGFNRSYAGVHAANFGNGTYFAVNANYSAHDLYSKPDVNGKKYMYLARVLVGEYSLGKKGSITPARKNVSNSVDLFDSSTDNMSQPSMFIIFNDIQAYPEYLITFTKIETPQECDELVRKLGNLQPGCAVITGAGKLPCKNVIHAVGPRWNEKESQRCTWLLKKTVKKCLQLAEIYNHCSIALPAISGGIYGFPPQMCADSIVSSVKETLEELIKGSSLKEVHLVSNSEEMVQVLSETVKTVFSAESFCPKKLMLKKSQKENRKGDLKMVTTNEGLCIRVEKKNVQEVATDVVVNSVGTDLQFGVGPLCKALLGRAGPALQDEFDTAVQSQVAGPGSVLCTSGCATACKSMLHAILPKWDGGQSEKVLEDVINFCLKKTEELGLKSITFPAIGTGGFGFPKTIVSKLMFDVTFRFSSSHTWKNLQEVHFLLSPQDIDNIQAFTSELELRADESCNAAAAQPSFVRPVSAELLGVHEMKIGSITLQVISGDITKQDTEVIVNISNPSFDAKTGVFKAIMDAAGSQVADECAQYAGQYQSGFITTQGGNLLCSKIIHLITNNQVKSQVSNVLHECEQKMYKSVAFPAIGTGQAGQSSAKVADEMLDAIVEFTRQKSVQHLQTIKIVIFQTNMLRDFCESMKKREDTDSSTTESWLSMFKSFFWGRKQSSEKKKLLILEKKICGESQEKVDATESWIKDLILKEQFETTISDEAIESFDEMQINILEDLQRRKRVTIQFLNHLSPPQIKISGISRDVYSVSLEVQNMVQQIKYTEEEQSKAELFYNLVEWRYPGSNDSFVAFDKLTNMQLEHAKMSKKLYLNVKIRKKNYKVDLNTLKATDDQGKTINLQRVMKDEDMQSIELPKEWTDMQNEQVKVVELQPSHPEYKTVEKMFKTTCADFNIEKIERIQNRILWQTYQLKKKSICEKNKNQDNEKLLFHGTAASSLRLINCYGFNRGYAGKNAAAIGNGTYFAVNARYSAQNTYSVPDVNGKKHMYLARVLTGEYCAGQGGLKAPPPRSPADPTDLYDSVVDNELNPTVFVIFSSHAALQMNVLHKFPFKAKQILPIPTLIDCAPCEKMRMLFFFLFFFGYFSVSWKHFSSQSNS